MQVRFPKTVPKQGPRNRFGARFQAGTKLAGTGSQASVPRTSWFPSKISKSNWEPLRANLFLGTLLENLFLATLLQGNLAWEPFPGNIAWELFPGTLLANLFLGNCLGTCSWEPVAWEPLPGNLTCEPVLGNLVWAPVPGNLRLGTLLGNLFLEILLGNQLAGNLGHLFVETSSWKHLFENLFWKPCFAWKSMLLEILLGKWFLETLKTVPEIRACKTCSWEPCLGTSCWEPLPGNPCLGTCFLGTLLGTCLGTSFLLVTSSWEPLLGNLFLVTLLGNLALLGTSSWEPCLGTYSWEPCLGTSCLGTSCWEPLLGILFLGTSGKHLTWEPVPGNLAPTLRRSGCSEGFSCKRKFFLGTFQGTRFPADLAAPTCSGTFTMAEDPKLTLLGKNQSANQSTNQSVNHFFQSETF